MLLLNYAFFGPCCFRLLRLLCHVSYRELLVSGAATPASKLRAAGLHAPIRDSARRAPCWASLFICAASLRLFNNAFAAPPCSIRGNSCCRLGSVSLAGNGLDMACYARTLCRRAKQRLAYTATRSALGCSLFMTARFTVACAAVVPLKRAKRGLCGSPPPLYAATLACRSRQRSFGLRHRLAPLATFL